MQVILRNLPTCIAWMLICASFACSTESDATVKQKPTARSWADVKDEIDRAFKDCAERVLAVTRKDFRVATFGGDLGGSQRPGTSFQELIFHRNPKNGEKAPVKVLDALIEREYDIETGRASRFRIVRYYVKDEGHEMLSEVEKYFKEKKLPYEIVDRKKPAKRPGEKPKVSPAF